MNQPPTNSEVYALIRNDFQSFLKKVFETVSLGEEFLPNWHIVAIVWHIEMVMRGDTRNLMLNVPPRTLKSIIVSVAWPAFILGHDPTRRIFVVSHGLDLAAELHALFRKVV